MIVQTLIETALANGYEVRISPKNFGPDLLVTVTAWKDGELRVETTFPTLPEAADACLHDIHSR